MNTKILKSLTKRAAAAMLLCAFIAAPGISAQKTDYQFKRTTTHKSLNRYFTTLYMIDDNKVVNLTGPALCELNDPLTALAVNPAGINYVVLSKNKKGATSAAVYATEVPDMQIDKFPAKKYGSPKAAVYTPDARQMLLATEFGLHLFDAKKFKLLQTLPLDLVTTNMIMS